MDLKDKIVVVTAPRAGIGRSLAIRFASEGAKHVVCADLNLSGAAETANQISGTAIEVNVGREEDIAALIERVETEIGPIDLFVSNAGILTVGGMEVPNEDWQRIWDINVMSHVWAARHVVPRHGGTWRWLPVEHRLGGGAVEPGRCRALRGHKTCGSRIGRMACDDPWRSGYSRIGSLPSGGAQ